jgi:hypothetical protein
MCQLIKIEVRLFERLDIYRPISILSPVSKLFEQLLVVQVYAYLESENLLNAAQFAFRKNLSCELALNTLMKHVRSSLDSGKDVIALLLDYKKAYDTLDQELLIPKLPYYDFDNNLIKLIKSYLTNRTIKVKVNGKLSQSKLLNIGVPQGSVLGPLLFILFINDMCLLPIKSKLIVFADDTTLVADGPYPETIIRTLETDLIIITEWFRNNKLVLNAKKSQAICFNSNQKLDKKIQKSRSQLTINCENNKIAMVEQVKLLGIVIDNKLLFGPQTDALIG